MSLLKNLLKQNQNNWHIFHVYKKNNLVFVTFFSRSDNHSSAPVSLSTAPILQGKKVFYDSLSIVLNKYIVPVGNWGLFEGTSHGIQKHIGEDLFRIKSNSNLIEVSIKDQAHFIFFRDQIDTNAIELIESISRIFDTTFAQFTDLDKHGIVHAAITGMMDTLEPNSYFIEPEDLKRLQDQNRGFFDGIGLEITTKDGVVTIVTPYEGTPAFRQGLKPNDRILAVNNETTQNMPIMEVSEKIRGEKGKPVTLTIERHDWIAPRNVTLNRDTISHRTIKSYQLEPGFGYIRIINFLSTTDDDFTAALNDLIKTSHLKGLIIDLRYNPGGLLNQSLGLADFFLNKGIITSTAGRIKTDSKTFYARPKTLANDYPIVIIINEGTASGSEIIASSLRFHERAVLAGEKSFGKGFMQATFPIQTGGAIRLTTSRLLTPDGNEIQGVGVSPDLNISPSLLNYKKSSGNATANIPTLATGSSKDDPAIQISLDILKRSLLLQDTSIDNLTGLSDEQVKIKKRFHGLKKAIEEVSRQEKSQNF